jgi:hypothetical protein
MTPELDNRRGYPPLDTLNRVADDVWVVDGPLIRFGSPPMKMPFPTRMTVIRLGSGDLLIHSPTPLARLWLSRSEKPRPRLPVGRRYCDAADHRGLHDRSRDVPPPEPHARTHRLDRELRAATARLRHRLALTRLAGTQDPDGAMPRDMRATFARHRSSLRVALETMIAWNPERVILAHCRWYERDGAQELRRAFRWVLDPAA